MRTRRSKAQMVALGLGLGACSGPVASEKSEEGAGRDAGAPVHDGSHVHVLDASRGDGSSAPPQLDAAFLDGAVLPDALPGRLLTLTWDPYFEPTPSGGELFPNDAHFQRDGLYVEYWAIDRYGHPGAMHTDAHSHIGDLAWMTPGLYGNGTNQENQHAFGAILQGFYIRPADGGAFDLVSLEYRIRRDDDPEHVSSIPGVTPTDVQIWIATELDVAVPPTHPFTRYSIGRQDQPGMSFTTLRPEGFENISGVFISSTGNVCFDNVVIRTR